MEELLPQELSWERTAAGRRACVHWRAADSRPAACVKLSWRCCANRPDRCEGDLHTSDPSSPAWCSASSVCGGPGGGKQLVGCFRTELYNKILRVFHEWLCPYTHCEIKSKKDFLESVYYFKTIKNTNLVEVSIWFPYIYPLLSELRISDPAKLTLDVEELAHIPGPTKQRFKAKAKATVRQGERDKLGSNSAGLVNLKHTHQSGWRIYTLSRALAPEAKLQLAGEHLEMGLHHRPFSETQNI